MLFNILPIWLARPGQSRLQHGPREPTPHHEANSPIASHLCRNSGNREPPFPPCHQRIYPLAQLAPPSAQQKPQALDRIENVRASQLAIHGPRTLSPKNQNRDTVELTYRPGHVRRSRSVRLEGRTSHRKHRPGPSVTPAASKPKAIPVPTVHPRRNHPSASISLMIARTFIVQSPSSCGRRRAPYQGLPSKCRRSRISTVSMLMIVQNRRISEDPLRPPGQFR